MSGSTVPKFDETDPRWIRIAELRARMGIKHAQFQRIHRQIGGEAFEHRGDGKPGTPVWVFAPLWLAAWKRDGGEQPAEAIDHTKLIGKKKQEYYDGETAQANYRKLMRELVPVAEVKEVFGVISTELSAALTSAQRISPEACERVLTALDSAKEQVSVRFNGHAHANGTVAAVGPRGAADRKRAAVPAKKPARVRRARGDHPDR